MIQTRFEYLTPNVDVQSYFKLLKANEYHRLFNKEGALLAKKELEDLLAVYPNVSEIHTFLGMVYIQQLIIGTCKSDLFCFGKATEAARKSLSLDSNDSDAHLLASYIFSMRKEYDKAIAEAQKAIMLNPNSADAYAGLGFALIVSDRPEEAIGIMKKAIRLNPIPPVWYISDIAWAYRVSKQYDKAIETFRRCVRRQSDYVPGYVGLALSYQLSGLEEEAKATVKKIIDINPDYSIEVYTKWATYKNKEELERSVEALRKAGLPE